MENERYIRNSMNESTGHAGVSDTCTETDISLMQVSKGLKYHSLRGIFVILPTLTAIGHVPAHDITSLDY